ncbi:MAG TPA: FAD-dependent oxidoreductase [Candidatus Saccharimonadales bacterium]|nr:FAD-dependent oxidoreductase [Candidatus Saccharimonadales bacterium]
MSKNKVLIVGGGFGGVKAALELYNLPNFAVTLLSDDNSLRYYPTLYQSATGGSRSNSSIPYGTIFAGSNIELVQGEAVTIDRAKKQVITKTNQTYGYDYLILALGVVTNYFGIPGLSEFSYSIKSQAEAARFKEHLHKQLIDEGKPDLHYIIVGAGPTGIELAGALPNYLKHIIKNHGLPNKNISVSLIEAMPRLLPNLPKPTSRQIKRRLKKLGIKVYLNSKVEGETVDALTINGQPIKSHTVVWTAGVTNHPFFANNHFVIMGRGKVGVDAYLQAEPNIFVIGDNANTPFSGMAQTALHDGAFVANNLIRAARGEMYKSYVVKKPITVIPAGENWAAVDTGKFRVHGRIGFLVREAADLKGFKDLETWSQATKQFFLQFRSEDGCEVCALAHARY